MLPHNIIIIYKVTYVTNYHNIYIYSNIKINMRIELHQEAFETNKRAIFKWALEVEGLEKSQRIIGLHASRGILELLSVFLHKRKLIDEGFQLNHRWFKTEKVSSKLPEFENKKEIISKIVRLENLCEILSYGTQRPLDETQQALNLSKELEEILNKQIPDKTT